MINLKTMQVNLSWFRSIYNTRPGIVTKKLHTLKLPRPYWAGSSDKFCFHTGKWSQLSGC